MASELLSGHRYFLNTLKFPRKAKEKYRITLTDKTERLPRDLSNFFNSLTLKQSNRITDRLLTQYIDGNIPAHILYLATNVTKLLHVRAICVDVLEPNRIIPVKTLLLIGNTYHVSLAGTLLKFYYIAIRAIAKDVLKKAYSQQDKGSPNTISSNYRRKLVRDIDNILEDLLDKKVNMPISKELEHETLLIRINEYILTHFKVNYRKIQHRGIIKDLDLATTGKGNFKTGKLLW